MASILMVASEAAPFAKTGGLGEVMEALPKALVQAGQDVAVVLPLYRQSAVSNPRLVYERLQFGFGPHAYSANILEQFEEGVRYLFVQIPELYDRDQFYAEHDVDYPDNHVRFAALCHAALRIERYLFPAAVIHCHDWQAALLPLLLRDTYRLHPAYLGAKTVFTIHNLGYQGVCSPDALADLGLPQRLFRADLLALNGDVNILKGGLVSSDMLTTVSPRYAQEIQTPEFGLGLDTVLRARRNSLTGILNGADYRIWDPASDPSLPQNFEAGYPDGKQACKRALLAEMGLSEERSNRPVIAIVSRLAEQKGFDLLMEIPHEIASTGVTLIVVGSGEQRYEDFFRWFATAYPDRVALFLGYQEELAHRVHAGADMILMPSRYEPCGLNQIYGMRYGALPVVHATGGLDDTVDSETGFKFNRYTPQDLLDCLRAALQVFGTPEWPAMVKTAMQRNFSWHASAARYIHLYRRLTG